MSPPRRLFAPMVVALACRSGLPVPGTTPVPASPDGSADGAAAAATTPPIVPPLTLPDDRRSVGLAAGSTPHSCW
jgi:hypothetical protein